MSGYPTTHSETRQAFSWFNAEIIATSSLIARPRAAVILLGWLGARSEHLEKYTAVWNERNCNTVTVRVPGWISMMDVRMCRRRIAVQVLREVDRVVRFAEMQEAGWGKLPVLMHVLSNGGAFVCESVQELLEEVRLRNEKIVAMYAKKKLGESNIKDNHDVDEKETEEERLFRHVCMRISDRLRIGCTIFDSAPGYISYMKALKVIEDVIPLPIVVFVLQFLFLFFIIASDYIPSKLFNTSTKGDSFWEAMKHCCLSSSQAYVYSTKDEVIDYRYLDDLVRLKKVSDDINVLKVLRFTDSSHVQHLRYHKEVYEEMIDNILDTVAQDTLHIHPNDNDSLFSDEDE